MGVIVRESYVNGLGTRRSSEHGTGGDGCVVAGRAGVVGDGEEEGDEAWRGLAQGLVPGWRGNKNALHGQAC